MGTAIAALSVVLGIIAVPVGILYLSVKPPDPYAVFYSPCLGMVAIVIALLMLEDADSLRVKVLAVTGFVLGVLALMYCGMVLAAGATIAQFLQTK